jgi:hypothetical protein
MKQSLLFLTTFAFSTGLAICEESLVENRQFNIASFTDLGQVVKGYSDGPDTTGSIENLFMFRSGIGLLASGTVGENLEMVVGLGGLMWKPFPETGHKPSRYVLVGPGIAEASAKYKFKENLSLKMGLFSYKYNESAQNLGEYLFRSEAYPTLVSTQVEEGWVWLNAYSKSMGLKLSHSLLEGAFNHEILLFSEFGKSPIFDFSPGYVAKYQANGFQVGAGVSFHRLFPVKPSVTTPRTPTTTTQTIAYSGGLPWIADVTYLDGTGDEQTVPTNSWQYGGVFNEAAFLAENAPGGTITEIKVTQRGTAPNEALTLTEEVHQKLQYCDATGACQSYYNTGKDSVLVVQGGSVVTDADGNPAYSPINIGDEHILTFKGIKVMAFGALDFNQILDLAVEDWGSFKVFTEVAVLGVQNQPVYYEDITKRIPMMVGVNIPTGGIFDVVSLQCQYFPSDLPDNRSRIDNFSQPLPGLPEDSHYEWLNRRDAGDYKEDDLKWSVSLQKNLIPGLQVLAQAANDHIRTQNSCGDPGNITLTNQKSLWY